MYTAEWIDAQRAVKTGIATRAFNDSELMAAAQAKAQEIAQWPVSSLVATKKLMRDPHRPAIRAALAAEEAAMMQHAGSPENIEAVVAFLEKRAPDFRQFRG
jgi:enoyl-CoA hydratase/carnithine racemase